MAHLKLVLNCLIVWGVLPTCTSKSSNSYFRFNKSMFCRVITMIILISYTFYSLASISYFILIERTSRGPVVLLIVVYVLPSITIPFGNVLFSISIKRNNLNLLFKNMLLIDKLLVQSQNKHDKTKVDAEIRKMFGCRAFVGCFKYFIAMGIFFIVTIYDTVDSIVEEMYEYLFWHTAEVIHLFIMSTIIALYYLLLDDMLHRQRIYNEQLSQFFNLCKNKVLSGSSYIEFSDYENVSVKIDVMSKLHIIIVDSLNEINKMFQWHYLPTILYVLIKLLGLFNHVVLLKMKLEYSLFYIAWNIYLSVRIMFI